MHTRSQTQREVHTYKAYCLTVRSTHTLSGTQQNNITHTYHSLLLHFFLLQCHNGQYNNFTNQIWKVTQAGSCFPPPPVSLFLWHIFHKSYIGRCGAEAMIRFLRCLWRLPGNSFFSCYKRVCSWNSFGFNNPHIMLSVVSFVCKRWLDAHGCRFTGLNQWKDRQTKGRTDGQTSGWKTWSMVNTDLWLVVKSRKECQVPSVI